MGSLTKRAAAAATHAKIAHRRGRHASRTRARRPRRPPRLRRPRTRAARHAMCRRVPTFAFRTSCSAASRTARADALSSSRAVPATKESGRHYVARHGEIRRHWRFVVLHRGSDRSSPSSAMQKCLASIRTVAILRRGRAHEFLPRDPVAARRCLRSRVALPTFLPACGRTVIVRLHSLPLSRPRSTDCERTLTSRERRGVDLSVVLFAALPPSAAHRRPLGVTIPRAKAFAAATRLGRPASRRAGTRRGTSTFRSGDAACGS